MKMRREHKKRGYIAIEWLIISAIVIVAALPIYYEWLPTQVRNTIEAGTNSLSVLFNFSGKVPDFSGSNDSYPSAPDKWTPDSTFLYSLTGDLVTITGLADSSKKELIIPETIQDKKVAAISANAFANSGLTKVLLPNTITTIGARSFQGNSLTEITIPNQVTQIGEYAFENNKINLVSLSNKLTVINQYTFAKNKISRIAIPSSVTTIGNGAFRSNGLSSVDIPDTVTDIGTDAFSSNVISNIILGSMVSRLGEGAFSEQNVSKAQVKVLGNSDVDKGRFDSRWTTIFRVVNGVGNEVTRLK